MNTNQMKQTVAVMGGVMKKIAESAVHAAVFAFVSKKVTSFMTKKEEEEKTAKLRLEDSTTKLDDSRKAGCASSTERI